MQTFFSSDHHFGHANIIKYCNRPFKDVEEMNEEMVARWNSRVGVDDCVMYLGDFSLSESAVIQYSHRLNGKKILIPGNHDQCFPHKRSPAKIERATALYEKNGWAVYPLDCHMTNTQGTFRLCHFPYLTQKENEEYDVRYKQYRPERTDERELLFHGHVHGTWKTLTGMVNVGVDVWDFYPVTIQEILDYKFSEFSKYS